MQDVLLKIILKAVEMLEHAITYTYIYIKYIENGSVCFLYVERSKLVTFTYDYDKQKAKFTVDNMGYIEVPLSENDAEFILNKLMNK